MEHEDFIYIDQLHEDDIHKFHIDDTDETVYLLDDSLWILMNSVVGNMLSSGMRESDVYKCINDIMSTEQEKNIVIQFPMGYIGFVYDRVQAGFVEETSNDMELDFASDVIESYNLMQFLEKLYDICLKHDEFDRAILISSFAEILSRLQVSNLSMDQL